MPQTRGSYQFELGGSGALVANDENLKKLRRLFRDNAIIDGNWGPGNPGDFDHGSWHILCHLAGGSGVLDTPNGRTWCGITHVPATDTYQATVTRRDSNTVRTDPLRSPQGQSAVRGGRCLGFIEGASQGHILARGVNDPRSAFNGWPRQMFDLDVGNDDDGGVVWEQWSTTRDLRESSRIGMSVLQAWLELVALLGGRYVAAVARGRREHNHPRQLVALVRAGVVAEDEATWDITPQPISMPAQDLLYEARPADMLKAAEQLGFDPGRQSYFMFKRRIGKWSPVARVRSDLDA